MQYRRLGAYLGDVKTLPLLFVCTLADSACGVDHAYRIERPSWEYVRSMRDAARAKTAVLAIDENRSAVYLDARFVTTAAPTFVRDQVYVEKHERRLDVLAILLVGLGGACAFVAGIDDFGGTVSAPPHWSVPATSLTIAGLLAQVAGVVLMSIGDGSVAVPFSLKDWTYVNGSGPHLGL